MIDWKVKESGYDPDKVTDLGQKFLVANGYMGIRGTLEEHTKEQLAAVNLAGIYDKNGDGWREPLNAPNPLYTVIKADNILLSVLNSDPADHNLELDYRKAILCRETLWKTESGIIKVENRRFASMAEPHLIVMQYSMCTDYAADISIETGIDADIWEINGPHYSEISLLNINGIRTATAQTQEQKDKVFVGEASIINHSADAEVSEKENKIMKTFSFRAEANKVYSITKFAVIYTSKDCNDYEQKSIDLINRCLFKSYEEIEKDHIDKWEEIWNISEIIIEGDDNAMEAINYSIYHLQSIAPRHTDNLSIAARGLSGQMYKGAVFWDTEMFMLDLFINTFPDVAKSLINYRINTLEGALKKAKQYGYDGAFYAWESQEGGYDACSDYNVVDVFTGRPMRTYFKDKQVHISSAVVYGIMKYVNRTGDTDILKSGGAKVIIECAKFYYSCLMKKLDKNSYDILDVIGPDEYHERVDNNGYTNRMAKYTFETCIQILQSIDKNNLKEYNTEELLAKFEDASEKIYIQQPEKNGIIPQFDGFLNLEDTTVDELKKRIIHPKEYWGGAYGIAADTQISKQADIVAWLSLFPDDFSAEIAKRNWEYYNQRTEHGSSLSASMYANLACHLGMPDKAYPYLMKSASADINGGSKQWAGLVYIGGTHPAAAGGAYINLVYGFAGVKYSESGIEILPKLPEKWTKLKFRIWYKNKLYEINTDRNRSRITEVSL